MNIFELAARKKFRFNSEVGTLTVEQLFDLPIETKGKALSLQKLASILQKQIQDEGRVEAFSTSRKSSALVELEQKMNILVIVRDSKLKDAEAVAERKAKESDRSLLLFLLEDKRKEALASMSEDEIRKLLAN